jgi:hypothetical protein
MLEDIVKLANDELVLQRSMYPVYLVTRRATDFGVLTWVGKYEIVPDKYFGRNGSYFGLGVWFLNSILDGVEVVNFIEKHETELCGLMETSTIHGWDIKELVASQLGITGELVDQVSKREHEGASAGIGVKPKGALGFHVLASGSGDQRDTSDTIRLGKVIDYVLREGQLSDFSRMIFVRDGEAAGALRGSEYAVEWPASRPTRKNQDRGRSSQVSAQIARRDDEDTGKRRRFLDRIGGSVFNRLLPLACAFFALICVLSTLGNLYLTVPRVVRSYSYNTPDAALTSAAAMSNASPLPSGQNESRLGDNPSPTNIQDANQAGNFNGVDQRASNLKTRRVGENNVGDITRLIAQVDSILQDKDFKWDMAFQKTLEHTREEAQKQLDLLRSSAPSPEGSGAVR